jgi:hypothetical protein
LTLFVRGVHGESLFEARREPFFSLLQLPSRSSESGPSLAFGSASKINVLIDR